MHPAATRERGSVYDVWHPRRPGTVGNVERLRERPQVSLSPCFLPTSALSASPRSSRAPPPPRRGQPSAAADAPYTRSPLGEVVAPSQTVREALFIITRGRMGLALVVDEGQSGGLLRGIVTDGDVGRAIYFLGDVRGLIFPSRFVARRPSSRGQFAGMRDPARAGGSCIRAATEHVELNERGYCPSAALTALALAIRRVTKAVFSAVC